MVAEIVSEQQSIMFVSYIFRGLAFKSSSRRYMQFFKVIHFVGYNIGNGHDKLGLGEAGCQIWQLVYAFAK